MNLKSINKDCIQDVQSFFIFLSANSFVFAK